MLGSICELLPSALGDNGKDEAYQTGQQTLHCLLASLLSRGNPLTYADDSNDEIDVTIAAGAIVADKSIGCSNGSNPMHARDGSCKQQGADKSTPPAVDPSLVEVKEQQESRDTGDDGNGSGANNICSRVVKMIVTNTKVADVMHSGNGKASNETRDDEEQPESSARCRFQFDKSKAEEQKDNWKEDRERGESRIVEELKFLLTTAKNDGSISDEMHAPY
jgi:hypothetical protein